MTEFEAVACLRASPELRRRQRLRAAALLTVMGSVAATLFSVWVLNLPWDAGVTQGVIYLLMGGALGWLVASADSLYKRAAAVETAVLADVIKAEGPKVIVVLEDGTELMWWVESPRKLDLQVGERLWLASPVRRGVHVFAVVDSMVDGGDVPVVLWPGDVAWTPGRWDK